MNVFAGTITSSPGSRSIAIRASLNASRPLATPTQSVVPQKRANAASNSRDLRAVGVRIRVDQPADVLENPLLERLVDQREIEERNLGEGGFGDIEHLPATVVGRLFVCHSPLRGPHLAIRIARTRPPPRPLNGLSGLVWSLQQNPLTLALEIALMRRARSGRMIRCREQALG